MAASDRPGTSADRAAELLGIERDLAIALGRARDVGCALDAILDAALRLGEVDSGGLYLFDEAGVLRVAAHRGLGPAFVEASSAIAPDDPRVALVRAGTPLFAPFASLLPSVSPAHAAEGLRALGVVPVREGAETVAVLNVASHVVDDFSPVVRDALVAMGAQIGGVVERVRSDASVRASQRDFQALFDSLNDFLFVLDAQGSIIHTNAVVVRRLGYSTEELEGMPVTAVHPPEQRDEAMRIVGEMLAGSTAYCPIPLLAKSGARIAVETVVSHGSWNGRPAILGISRDITRRKLAEEALHASEATHRAIVDHAPLGIARLDRDGRFLGVNGAFARMVAQEPAALVGVDLAELTHPDDVSESIARFRGLLAGEIEGYQIEQRYLRRAGSYVWAEVSVSAVRAVGGAIDFVLLLATDVTARKHLQAAHAEVERRFRQMADASPVLLWVADAAGGRTFFNRTWHDFTGRTSVQELGDGWLDGVHEDDRAAVEGAPTSGERRGGVEREYRLRDRDGAYRWILERVSLRAGDDGATIGSIGSCLDITERKRTETEREALVAELQGALATVKTLRGLLPICAWCKKVRDDGGYWSQIEHFLLAHSEAELSHGVCPDCTERYFPEGSERRLASAREEQ